MNAEETNEKNNPAEEEKPNQAENLQHSNHTKNKLIKQQPDSRQTGKTHTHRNEQMML